MAGRTQKPSSPSSSDPNPGSASPPRRRKSKLTAALNAIQISDKDVVKWMQLIELRGSKNELYKMADRFQANLIITGLMTIQNIYQKVSEGMDENDITLDQINKLTTSFNRAVASINQALSYLGVTGNKREEEPETDALADFLTKARLENESLPILRVEFEVAEREMAGMGIGGDANTGAIAKDLSSERRLILASLKKEMKSYDEGDVGKEDEKVVDVEIERSSTL